MFLVSLGLYLVATIATGLTWSAGSFWVFRLFTGLGIGGEYAAINSAIDELIPARARGRLLDRRGADGGRRGHGDRLRRRRRAAVARGRRGAAVGAGGLMSGPRIWAPRPGMPRAPSTDVDEYADTLVRILREHGALTTAALRERAQSRYWGPGWKTYAAT